MRVTGGSDLARLQMLQKQAFETRNKLDVAGQELTTNLKASRFDATGGNLTRLFALERSLDRNAVFTQTISLTELRLDVMQESLGRMLTPAQDLSLDLVADGRPGRLCRPRCCTPTTAREAFAATVGHPQHPGRRPVALRRHRHRQPGAGAGGRDPRRSRRAGGRGAPTRGATPSRRSTPISPSRRPAPSTPAATSARAPTSRRCRSARASGSTTACAPRTTELVAVLRVPGDGGGGRRRRLRRQPGRADGAARRRGRPDARRQGGHPRPARRASAAMQETVERAKAAAGLRARDARPRAHRRSSRPTRSRRPRPTRRSSCSSSRSTP